MFDDSMDINECPVVIVVNHQIPNSKISKQWLILRWVYWFTTLISWHLTCTPLLCPLKRHDQNGNWWSINQPPCCWVGGPIVVTLYHFSGVLQCKSQANNRHRYGMVWRGVSAGGIGWTWAWSLLRWSKRLQHCWLQRVFWKSLRWECFAWTSLNGWMNQGDRGGLGPISKAILAKNGWFAF